MPAQCRRFFGSVGHGGPAAVVPAEKLIPRAGEAGIVVGVRVGEDQQKPLLLPDRRRSQSTARRARPSRFHPAAANSKIRLLP